MKNKLVILDMYRAKNKNAFFAIHQAITKLSEFDIEFHILWDNENYIDEWSQKIDDLDCKIISYTKKQMDDYCADYGISRSRIQDFKKFTAIYLIIHTHYLLKNKITDYCLIYDDDIVFNDDLDELKNCLKNKIPCLITEVLNSGCDKSMIYKLLSLYEGSEEYYMSVNPRLYGFNAGFQGVSLDMYEDFLEPEYFSFLLDLFNYSGIYDSSGKEILGFERSLIDTQEQSFFGVMNIIRSRKRAHILSPDQYYICANWGVHPKYGEINTSSEYEGWEINLKSKVVHFIGHTILNGVYYGKPKIYNKLVDEYLKKHKII